MKNKIYKANSHTNLQNNLVQSEQIFEKTGYYQGIEKLQLKENDPLRFERVFSKLRGGLVSARETALHIAASPIVRYLGELCFGLYTPEGDAIAVSTGIMVHVHTMSDAIKWMIRQDYEDDPGIKEGDVFCNNDPYCGDAHTADVQTIIPIFYKKKIIGWAAGVTHVIDTGSPLPGHDPLSAKNRFEDGIHISCEKIGERDKIWKHYKIRCQLSTRQPKYWDFDEKARLAGCFMIRDCVYRVIKEEGFRYFKQFMYEAIEDGRRIFKARIKERLIPGTYRTATFMGEESPDYTYYVHAPLKLEIKSDGSFNMSFEGANKAGENPSNCSPSSMQAGLWVLITQILNYDGKVNDGAYFATKLHLPKGAWCNPDNPYLSYAVAWASLIPAYMGLVRLVSRSLFSRGFREEVISGYPVTADLTQGEGTTKTGDAFPVATFEISACGLGAGAIKDGLDYGYAVWNPESDMGDAEVWESLERAFPYLGRRIKKDSAGFGKYRGGSGWEALRLVYGAKHLQIYIAREGRCFAGNGIFGGYPHSTGYRLHVKNSNFFEIIKNKENYPAGDGSTIESEIEKYIKGDITKHTMGYLSPTEFSDGDIVLCNLAGGPGYGDPLEREIAAVKKDLDDGIYTKETVEKVYGVIASYNEETEEWIVDKTKSKEQRTNIKDERKRRSAPFSEFYNNTRERILKSEIPQKSKEVFNGIKEMSYEGWKEFLDFWELPDSFKL